MKYVSTRGAAPVLEFDDVLLTGLARDGGLYVPETWPDLPPLAELRGLPYTEVARRVITPFVVGRIDDTDLGRMIDDAYATFRHPDVVPLRELRDGMWLGELFHGPTLSFKDVALQLVGHLFEHVLAERGERVTIVGATSGDTGSAAIDAVAGRDRIDIVMLHPAGRVSEVQRRQMTTVTAANVHNVAVEGTFDDCQDLVKAMFNDIDFRDRMRLSAVNSINWARVMAQTVYYVRAAAELAADGRVAFAVPTGNFGNVFAGWVATQMGLPVDQLIIGTNSNDILFRFLEDGVMEVAGVHPTISPAMDIQVSSNVERLLFELYDRNGPVVAEHMVDFRTTGRLDVGARRLNELRQLFDAARLDDDQTRAVIRDTYERTGVLVDPHTAVGIGAAAEARLHPDVPLVVLSTAHPAKFPDAVEEATGIRPPLPDDLADLLDRPERFETLPNDLAAVEDYVTGRVV